MAFNEEALANVTRYKKYAFFSICHSESSETISHVCHCEPSEAIS
jgi:hypothetical protein